MKFFIGIAFIGRAVYIVQKIKKDPEIKKYDDNPKKALDVMAITGAVLFAVGCIGLSVLDALKSTIYIFANSSSFPVTVVPEFSDDIQIQAEATKSFESKHKDMELNYTPAKYVQVKKANRSLGNLPMAVFIFQEDQGFLIYPPENRQIMPYPGMQYKVIVGPAENNFVPNINFTDEKNPFNKIITYVSISADKMKAAGTKTISRGKFSTANGTEGYKIETNTENFRKSITFLKQGKQYL